MGKDPEHVGRNRKEVTDVSGAWNGGRAVRHQAYTRKSGGRHGCNANPSPCVGSIPTHSDGIAIVPKGQVCDLLPLGLLVFARSVPVGAFALRADSRFPIGFLAWNPLVPAALAPIAPDLDFCHIGEYIPRSNTRQVYY